jgi:Domain of unknown function (DUF3597)
MSIFGSIAAAIFGKPAHADTAPPAQIPAAQDASPAAYDGITPIVVAANDTSPTAPARAKPAPGATAAKTAPVDVMAILDKIDDETDEKLDWSKSIVDLMKLLKLDSSLSARKELAEELGYDGDMKNSAEMNVWLHKAVMTKLAENGGVVPDALKH